MSRRWTAKCWLGSKSGYVDIEVGASSLAGAKEQLQNIYGAEQIINLREIRGDSGGGMEIPSGGGVWLVGILGTAALFLYFTPWVLMTVYGAGGTWLAQKFTGQTMAEYSEIPEDETTDENHKKAGIVFASALFLGMLGFIHGTAWNAELNKEYNLDGKQPKVEQIRQK
jgi:hypothetical protein